MREVDNETIKVLTYKCRVYDGVTEQIKISKQRLLALLPAGKPEHQDEIKAMKTLKGQVTLKIGKLLKYWPIWTEWMKDVPGIGPFIAGNLVLLYYYRFVPICTKCGADLKKVDKTFICVSCGAKAKGKGILQTRIERREFPMVSSWWHYMGRHINKDGKMPKHVKNVASSWSSKNRTLGYHIGEEFNKQIPGHSYKAFSLKRKEKREKQYPDYTPKHRHNMAMNETVKLFLSHFWHVARTLEGKSTEGPYAEVILKHTNIIPPYYWKPVKQ